MRRLVFATAVLLVVGGQARAGVIEVTYTVTGSAENWDLNFTVANNMASAPDQEIYYFGVHQPGAADVSAPAGWVSLVSRGAYSNAGNGGSSTLYELHWIMGDRLQGIELGDSLSGFVIHSTAAVAPTEVKWFAYSYGNDPYTGGGNFTGPYNPGFEGTATPSSASAVPEPGTMSLLAVGGLGMMGYRLRRRLAKAEPVSVA